MGSNALALIRSSKLKLGRSREGLGRDFSYTTLEERERRERKRVTSIVAIREELREKGSYRERDVREMRKYEWEREVFIG